MATWNSRGLRGSGLEALINMTVEKYELAGLAVIQKIPTPITPVKIDENTRQISLAYFDKKSTVDYMGVVQGVPICFDAKECASDTYSLANIHEHQIEFMRKFEKQSGISFIILMYTGRDECYYIPFKDIEKFSDRAKIGGRKSFRYDEVNKSYLIKQSGGVPLHFLEQLKLDLCSR